MTRPLSAALLGAAALFVAGPGPARAQPQLAEVTVMASRLPAPLGRTPDAYVVAGDHIGVRRTPQGGRQARGHDGHLGQLRLSPGGAWAGDKQGGGAQKGC